MTTSHRQRLLAAHHNLIGAFAALIPLVGAGGSVQQFGSVRSVITGLPHPFYNPVFALWTEPTPDELRAALDASRAAGFEPSVQAESELDHSVRPVLRGLGFTRDEWRTPGMVLDEIPASIPRRPDELRIETVGDEAGLERFHTVFGSGPVFRSALPVAALERDDFRILVGSDEEGPTSCSLAIRTEHEFGIYAVGTVERARRRGYGTAMTWAAVAAGRKAWALSTAVLQSSEMGFGVYSKMGFVEVCRYVTYEPPKPPEPPTPPAPDAEPPAPQG